MDENDIQEYKRFLESEKVKLQGELSQMAKRDPSNKEDWVPSMPPARSAARADKNELADRFGDFEERRSTELQLEIRLNNIKRALKKIDGGSYGVCEECGKDINPKRLKANPAATTCIQHAQ